MKRLFTSKRLTIDFVKGFVFGIGLNDSNTNLIVLIGPIVFEIRLPRKESISTF
jgi:hypothetical protein